MRLSFFLLASAALVAFPVLGAPFRGDITSSAVHYQPSKLPIRARGSWGERIDNHSGMLPTVTTRDSHQRRSGNSGSQAKPATKTVIKETSVAAANDETYALAAKKPRRH